MEKHPKLDYRVYSTEELMDLYIGMDKQSNPELAREIDKVLREKLKRFPPPKRSNDLYEFLHISRIGWITGFIPAIGILFVVLNIMKSPDSPNIHTYYPKNLYIHLFIITLLGYGVIKRNMAARILLAIYIIISLSIYLFT